MTTSRLKFEFIDGSEPVGFDHTQWPLDVPPSKPPGMATKSRRAAETVEHLASLGQQSAGAEWTRKTEVSAPLLDPGLLQDLANGFEFLNLQLDDLDSELARSREQGRDFELEARRWEQEASRLREEAATLRAEGVETRRALDGLRREFDESRDGRQRQQEAVARVMEEMAEIRAGRSHLEELAAEQQRALLLSLALLKRTQAEPRQVVGVVQESPESLPGEKDREIAELKRLIEAAGEEGAALDQELVTARSELIKRIAERESARGQINSLRHELEAVSAGAESLKSDLAHAQAELSRYHDERQSMLAELASTRDDLSSAKKALTRIEALPRSIDPNPQLTQKVKDLAQERDVLVDKLRDCDSEIALQNAEVDCRGAIITALESALEEQNASLRVLEERFLAYAERVQTLQMQRIEMPVTTTRGLASKLTSLFLPPKRERPRTLSEVQMAAVQAGEEEDR